VPKECRFEDFEAISQGPLGLPDEREPVIPNIFDDTSIDIPCPKCGMKHPKTFGWIKANDRIDCKCGVSMILDKGKLIDELRTAEQMRAELKRGLARFGG
jgi:hypothetical protein